MTDIMGINCEPDRSEIEKIEVELAKYCSMNKNFGNLARVFHDFYLLLKARNEMVNLVANADYNEFLYRHVCDSLSVLKRLDFKKDEKIADIGSGAGFPGIPLKIVNDDVFLYSVESIRKKADFQSEVMKKLKLEGAEILNVRIEELARTEKRESMDKALARAVAPISVLAELALPLTKIGGVAVFYKAIGYKEELTRGKKAIRICGGSIVDAYKYKVRDDAPERILIIIEKTHSTPDEYPRSTGIPSKRPL
jgi:16S rRNA (guanine527-N7)-methyltransferase